MWKLEELEVIHFNDMLWINASMLQWNLSITCSFHADQSNNSMLSFSVCVVTGSNATTRSNAWDAGIIGNQLRFDSWHNLVWDLSQNPKSVTCLRTVDLSFSQNWVTSASLIQQFLYPNEFSLQFQFLYANLFFSCYSLQKQSLVAKLFCDTDGELGASRYDLWLQIT